ncbi:MAG: site-specific DNA-methyltransferase [Acidobacteria bacterium]|nr:site-specific DNA-methyltransferase [Acidobacteriota bacterium]
MTRAVPPSSPRPLVSHTHGHATYRFFHGDCVEVLAACAPASYDVVVTSPPYNLGIAYRSYDDRVPRDRFLAWTGEWLAAVRRVLHPEGSLFLNVGAKPSDPWVPYDIAQQARAHFVLQNTLHWVKSIAIDGDDAGARAGIAGTLAVGHYKPINSPRFVNDCHEFIFHFTPTGATPLDRLAVGVPYQDASNVTRWKNASSGRRCRGNTWFLPYETIQQRDRDRPHPATFPARLPEYCLRLHGLDRVRRVLDPFTGLGSTAVACTALGLSCDGIEIDRTYLAEAAARVEAQLGERS